MAISEHLGCLHQGVGTWNRWRTDEPNVLPDLSGVDIGALNLDRVNFARTNLDGIDLTGGTLREADLSDSSLRQANCQGAHAYGSKFDRADLSQANFSHAILSGATFDSTRLFETILGDTSLSGSHFLASCVHLGPSIIDLRTLTRSGELPREFLEGCGLSNSFIEAIPGLLTDPRYNTCFISYAEIDDAFASRLYSDLQGRGVRCWRWREDAKIGRSIMESIDEAITDYDRLILVCSKNSLASPVVVREIERALQREDSLSKDGRGREVLLPIRIDDHVLEEWVHHRRADVVDRNIGDFTNWEDAEAYEQVLTRLVRDLRMEPTHG